MSELRRLTLPGTAVTTTVLGFGCSGLLGDKTPEEGTRLLSAAYEAGIRHFDVARYYGYGDAEGLVGALAKGRRDQVTLTTKFGIQPIGPVAQSKGVIRVVRRVMRFSPLIRDLVRRKVSSLVQRGRFDVESARSSLETSLRELKTDYVDIFLLHECEPEDCQSMDLLEFLTQSRQQGKILSFGVGGAFSRIEAVCRAAPEFTAVAQFDSQLLSDHVRRVPQKNQQNGRTRALITFGSFSALSWLRSELKGDCKFAAQCSEALEADIHDPAVLPGLILQQALHANPSGLTIFRSSRPENIMQNVRSVTDRPFGAEALEQFNRLVSSRIAATPQ